MLSFIFIVAVLIIVVGFIWNLSRQNRAELAKASGHYAAEATVTTAHFTKETVKVLWMVGNHGSEKLQNEQQVLIDSYVETSKERYKDFGGSGVKKGVSNSKAACSFVGYDDLKIYLKEN